MPPNTLKVDRSTRYGNPWPVGMFTGFTAQESVERFRRWHAGDLELRSAGVPPDLSPLRGYNLACWCNEGEPCHVDVLLELANAPARRSEEVA